MGMTIAAEQIFTPAVAACAWLKKNRAEPIALFVPGPTQEEFRDLEQIDHLAESGAGAVVVGDLGDEWSFQRLNRAFRLLLADPAPRLVALGMTRYWRAPDGLRLDVAPFVKALEHASGAEARVLGKPAPTFFEQALTLLGSSASHTFMIGDDIRGDIQAAQELGIRGIQVRTGKFREADLELGIRPFAVLDSVADLQRWWEEEEHS